MRGFRIAVVSTLLIASGVAGPGWCQKSANAAKLAVGDPAPPLTVGRWIAGEPVTRFDPGKVYWLDLQLSKAVTLGPANVELIGAVNNVLNAAAWTYVAGTLQSVLTLLYYASLFSGGSRDEA